MELVVDGTLRVIIGYRALIDNEITVKNRFPPPIMDELFDRVAGAIGKFFPKIDLRNGFHQIAIRPGEDRQKTVFRTRTGSYEYYTVLPMGLCNTPGTFMQFTNETFADMLDKSVLCFLRLDDILIYSRTEDEHLQHVTAVLKRLKAKKLFCKSNGKLSKCEFMREVEFLSHCIDANGLRVSPDRTSTVQKWPTPQNTTDVRSFLGLSNFYRPFVQDYSRITLPLSELTKDDVTWKWDEVQQKAFERLKSARGLCSPPVLIILDQTKQFLLNVDVCDFTLPPDVGPRLTQILHVRPSTLNDFYLNVYAL
jgi:hypothetical protein